MIYGGSWEVMGEQLPTIRHAPRLDRQPPPPAPGGKTPLIDLNISSSHVYVEYIIHFLQLCTYLLRQLVSLSQDTRDARLGFWLGALNNQMLGLCSN